MSPAVRAELDRIDQFLAKRARIWVFDGDNSVRDEASELWAILTALRGPDSGDEGLKSATTCVVRTAALPLTAAAATRNSSIAFFASPEERFDSSLPAEKHFMDHARDAAEKLGLK